MKLEDSPEFQALAERGEKAEAPMREAWAWRRAIALIFCIITLHASIFYLVVTYAATFMSTALGFSSNAKFLLVTLSMAATAVVMPFGGAFTDRFGRKRFLLAVGLVSTGAVIWLFETAPGATPASFAAPLLMVSICLGLYASSTYGTMCDLLPTRVRSTGISLAYNVPVALFGGSAPLISAWLIERTEDIASPWYFYAATCVLSLIALLVLNKSDVDRANRQNVVVPSIRTHASTDEAGEVTV